MFTRFFCSLVFFSILLLSMHFVVAESPGEAERATGPLGNDGLIFTMPPTERWQVAPTKQATAVGFRTVKKDAVVAIQIMPDDMTVIDPSVSRSIMMQLRAQYKKNKTKMLIEPTIEQDDRFSLRIHERFEVGDGDAKKVTDQLHIYRFTGKFLVQMSMSAFVTTEDDLKLIQGEAEDIVYSITGPGVKKPAKSTSRPASATKPVDRPKGNGQPIPRPPKPGES